MPFHGQQLLFVCLGAYSLMVEHVAHNDAVAGSNPAKPIRQRKKKKNNKALACKVKVVALFLKKLLSAAGCRRVPQGAAGCRRVPQGAAGCRRVPQGAAGEITTQLCNVFK